MLKNNPVVSLYSTRGSPVILGAGTFISPNIILTCNHVVRGSKEMNVYVWYSKGVGKVWRKTVHIKARRIWSCKEYDFALLMTEEPFEYMHTAPGAPLDNICKIVCPHVKKHEFEGKLVYNSMIGDKIDTISYVIEGPVLKPGSSGAPLVYQDRLVGLHWGGGEGRYSKNKSVCIPFKYISDRIVKKFGYILDEPETFPTESETINSEESYDMNWGY